MEYAGQNLKNLKKEKSLLLELIEQVKLDGRLLVLDFRKRDMNEANNALVVKVLEENGLKVYLRDDIDFIEKPTVPTLELLQDETTMSFFSDEEIESELKKMIECYREEITIYEQAQNNGFADGIIMNPDTYWYIEPLIKVHKYAN